MDFSKIVIFELNQQVFGISIHQVRSIEKLRSITRLPQHKKWMKGIMDHLGEIIPIIDLKEVLGFDENVPCGQTRIIICTIHSIQFGIIVDSAKDVVDLDKNSIEDAPQELNSAYIKGVAKWKNSLLILLDLKSLFNINELSKVEEETSVFI